MSDIVATNQGQLEQLVSNTLWAIRRLADEQAPLAEVIGEKVATYVDALTTRPRQRWARWYQRHPHRPSGAQGRGGPSRHVLRWQHRHSN